MAEAAVGAIVAEQVVSTGVEVGAAAAIARPTQPLTGNLNQITLANSTDASAASLTRSHHTFTVIGDNGYIFGGKGRDGSICPPDIIELSIPTRDDGFRSTHRVYLASSDDISRENILQPDSRYEHAAAAWGRYIVIHGGRDENGPLQDGASCVWLWDTATSRWERLSVGEGFGTTPEPRYGHRIYLDNKNDLLVLFGGRSKSDDEYLLDAWLFDLKAPQWTQLPSAPPGTTDSAFVEDTLYGISTFADGSGEIHSLEVARSTASKAQPEWSTIEISANAVNPSSHPQHATPLVTVTSGFGRFYVLQLFTDRESTQTISEKDKPMHSDIWSLQVPSKALSAAGIKDAIRNALPKMDSGSYSWSEVQVPPVEPIANEGKAHPGPRGAFGASPTFDGKGAILWGGINQKGEIESDGWIVEF